MDKSKGKDPYKLLKGIKGIYNGNIRKKALYEAWDKWDYYYGYGKKNHEVYALCDITKPGPFKFGPYLNFTYRPFYIGSGKDGRRIDSAAVGRQRDKGGEKVEYLEDLKIRNIDVRIEILNTFYTRRKARVVEMKVIKAIPKNYLTNAHFPYCPIDLQKGDIMQQPVLLTC